MLDGIPSAMPALTLAEKVLARAGRTEVPAPGVDTGGGLAAGSDAASAAEDTPARTAEALGDRLLALVAQARRDHVDPEQALRDAVRRLSAQIQSREAGRKPR